MKRNPKVLSHPLPALLLAPFVARSLTLVPRSLLLNRTETLATQARFKVLQSSSKIEDISRKAKLFSRERLDFLISSVKLYSYQNHAQRSSRDHFLSWFIMIFCLTLFPFAVFIIDIIRKSVLYSMKNLEKILLPSFYLYESLHAFITV